ncbi:MAG: deoxyribodipyrimidine photo-lyase [Rhodocyclaceae bacterium]|nr:deoxyribodipyrimidine photo-lyase [Rhodocyclaceae bacterium]MBX3670984.1 deoxyribodipyrimidine photo-lyase [Rhodocyclaceae bacterium]
MSESCLVWLRRDLRLDDHAALHHALARHARCYCAFVFDTDILQALLDQGLQCDRRVDFIRRTLLELDADLAARGSRLIVRHGRPVEEIPRLARELGVAAVYANRDYEPAAITRDDRVSAALAEAGIGFEDFKDQVIFERAEILTGAGKPYSVFTPYKAAWLARLTARDIAPWPVENLPGKLAEPPIASRAPELAELGFAASDLDQIKLPTGARGAAQLFQQFQPHLANYKTERDYPARRGVSYLSVHLRFGTISIRECARLARAQPGEGAQTWLAELIWRDFYQQILWHHPRVVNAAFRPEYDTITWDDAPDLYAAWRAGRTGYPLVDAAMRQLNYSGYMHNRLRMLTASFFCKDLLLDWRRGERYFAQQLNDYDLAANNGGWQWAASTGCDAQPYFRIFNPVTQSEKFDAEGVFIRRYVLELAQFPARYIHAPWLAPAAVQKAAGCVIGRDYPAPIVDHAAARLRALERYGRVRSVPDPG